MDPYRPSLGAEERGALFLEPHPRLTAGDRHGAVDDGALGDRDAARDDVGANHRRGADLELVLDHEPAGDSAGDHRRVRVDLPVPFRRHGHAQRAADAAIPANDTAHHQGARRLHIPGQEGALRDKGRRIPDLIDQPALDGLAHPVLPRCAGVIIRNVRRLRMPIMTTFGARGVALITVLALLGAGCSREQQDWRSAEAADTSEAYGRFVEQHPDSELAVQARARLAQLAEERDWAQAGKIATADAYRGFLAEHPSGRWSEEARIRIEAFSLGSAPRLAPLTGAQPGGAPQGPSGVRALQLATAAAPPAVHETAAVPKVAQLIPAEPGEPAPAPVRSTAAGT